MKFGIRFPTDRAVADAGAVRALAQAVEDLGFEYINASEHILRVDALRLGQPMEGQNYWRDPVPLIGYLAGVTSRIKLVTGVLVLPVRQTVLVAKQAADLDVLSEGRFRLGVGLGWNEVEYQALGMEFHNRGRRIEEQVAVLRALWTQESVTFDGRWHQLSEAGIFPAPIQRPTRSGLGVGERTRH